MHALEARMLQTHGSLPKYPRAILQASCLHAMGTPEASHPAVMLTDSTYYKPDFA